MNSNTSVSMTREIDGVYLAINVTSSSYSGDGRSVKLAEQSAAIEKCVAGMPGKPLDDIFGGPTTQGNSAGLPAPDSAPPAAIGEPVEVADAELAKAAV